jgi:hypothetical protein
MRTSDVRAAQLYKFIADHKEPVMQHEIDRFGKPFKCQALNRLLREGYVAYATAKQSRSSHTTLVALLP